MFVGFVGSSCPDYTYQVPTWMQKSFAPGAHLNFCAFNCTAASSH